MRARIKRRMTSGALVLLPTIGIPCVPLGAAAQDLPPTVSAVVATPPSANEGERVGLSARVDNPGGRTLTYTWDPGDGSAPRTGPDLASIEHAFKDDGTFTVTVRIDDGAGGVAEASTTVSIENVLPVIEALASPERAMREEPVTVEAVARDAGSDDVLTYRWDFGDGTVRSGVDLSEATHRFPERGLHPVRLTVADDDGGRASRTVLVAVETTLDLRVSGAVNGSLTRGFEERPSFVAISPESSRQVPDGHCQLTVTATTDQGDQVTVGGLLPAPIRPGSWPVVRGGDQPPGTFAVQDHLDPDRPGVDWSGGMWTGQGEAGTVTFTHVDAEGLEGRIQATMREGDTGYDLSGWFTAVPTRVGGFAMSGGGVCFRSGVLAIERISPEPDQRNVDFDSAEVEVELTETFDAASLDDTTFRLEYRLPDEDGGPTGTAGAESYEQVAGVLEVTGERDFRFVPRDPLLDGVVYRATIVGGEEGIRGRGGERLESDRVWRFSTLVEPDDVRVAVFQVARNAPLVPGKTTLTRVYVEWEEKDEVHPDWQVTRFPARVEVEVNGAAGAYPVEAAAPITRPDRFTAVDSAQARNSVNFFGWQPSGSGGSSTLTATVEPTGQDRSPPRRFESGPLTIDHHTASPRLSIEARRLLVGPWEDGLPAAIRSTTAQITREGSVFAEQNMPVAGIRSRLGDLPVGEPALMFSWTQEQGLETYRGLTEAGLTALRRDEYLARRAHDAMAGGGGANLFLVFMPDEIQPGPSGHAYGDFPTRTVVVFMPETFNPQTVQTRVGTVAHEVGHTFGLEHRSACPDDGYQACLGRGKAGSDKIEGFRLEPDGSGGANKSKTEGNAEAPRTHAVLSLMHWDGIPAPALFILDEQYAELLAHPRLAAVPVTPAPARTGRSARGGPSGGGSKVASGGGAAVGTGSPGSGGAEPSQAGPWLRISGAVGPDGRLFLEPLDLLDREPPGATTSDPVYSLELLDESGETLQATTFGTVPFSPDHVRAEGDREGVAEAPADASDRAGGDPGEGGWFWASVPWSSDAATIVVERDGETRMRFQRTPNAPTVELDGPRPVGPEEDAVVRLAWSGSDDDGDPLAYTVFYSPDGQEDWQALTAPWTGRTELRLDRATLPEGPRPTLRVVATDGFNRTVATIALAP